MSKLLLISKHSLFRVNDNTTSLVRPWGRFMESITNVKRLFVKCRFLPILLSFYWQHLQHWNLRGDLGRSKRWLVFFSPSQNSESCTITLPPQQASTQRIRLKIRSIPKVEDGGQQPIALITSQCSRLYFLSSFSLKIVDPGRSWNFFLRDALSI